MSTVSFFFASARADVHLWTPNNGVFHSLESIIRRRGHASGLMQKVVDWADENNVTLQLMAQSFSRHEGLDNYQLIDFYSRYGFVRQYDGPTWPARMERKPNSQDLQRS